MDSLEASAFVSVIIPVYNDAARLRLCLDALSSQSYPTSHYEVIVIDNGSTEDIASVCKAFPFVKLEHEAAAGSYAARNKGIAAAKGSILAFTDADCLPSTNWLEEGVRWLSHYPQPHVVGGRVKLFAQNPHKPTAVELYEIVNGFQQDKNIAESFFSVTANLFTYRSTLDLVGPFNANLRSGGDVEWGHRAHALGVRMSYAPTVVISHPARRTWREIYNLRTRVTGGWHQRSKGEWYQQDNRPQLSQPQVGKQVSKESQPQANGFFQRALKSVTRLAKNHDLPAGQKAKVAMVTLFVHSVTLLERVRLELGGKERR